MAVCGAKAVRYDDDESASMGGDCMSECGNDFRERLLFVGSKELGVVFHNLETNELRPHKDGISDLAKFVGRKVTINYG